MSTFLADVSERGTLMAASDLRVFWQHPDTQQTIEIGRLGYDGETYTFEYTSETRSIPGFRPLMGLPFGRRYEDTLMPAVFETRVMSSKRPDYDAYMRSLGLDPANATEWDQIAAPAGTRVNDNLSFRS